MVHLAKGNKLSFRRTKKLIKIALDNQLESDDDLRLENIY